MAKRARLTVDEVLLYCDGSDEDYDDYIDDPNEPPLAPLALQQQ